MVEYTKFKGWQIEKNIWDGRYLPDGFHVEIYADIENKKIYSSELLSVGSFTRGNPDLFLGTVTNNRFYGGAQVLSKQALIDAIPAAQAGEPYPLYSF